MVAGMSIHESELAHKNFSRIFNASVATVVWNNWELRFDRVVAGGDAQFVCFFTSLCFCFSLFCISRLFVVRQWTIVNITIVAVVVILGYLFAPRDRHGLCGQSKVLDGQPELDERHRVLGGLHVLQEVAETVLVGQNVRKAEV